jgi:hypothetical protein
VKAKSREKERERERERLAVHTIIMFLVTFCNARDTSI